MKIEVLDLGTVPYDEGVLAQELFLEKRIKGTVGDTVLLLEHTPVLTLGRAFLPEHIRDRDFFTSRGIEMKITQRGGGVTYHAPGQLLVYPIVALEGEMRDVSRFLDILEQVTMRSLQKIGIPAVRNPERRGVWVFGKKIAFTGIKLRKWVTSHGVAVNINNEIYPFEMIDPCGEPDIQVTSAREITGKKLDMPDVKRVFSECFSSMLEKESLYAGKNA